MWSNGNDAVEILKIEGLYLMSKSIEGQKRDAKTEEGKLIFRFIVKKKNLQ